MVSDIYKDNHFITLIVPYNANVHVDAALEQIHGSFDTFSAEGWMHGILFQQLQFIPELLFLLFGQIFEMFLKPFSKCKMAGH